MSKQTAKRLSFTLRYDVYADTLEAVVLRYLKDKSVREFKTGVIDTLRMCWLAIALKELHELPPDQLKQSALNAIDSLEKHIAYIRATFGLESGTGNGLGRAIASPTPMMVVHPSFYGSGESTNAYGESHFSPYKSAKNSAVTPDVDTNNTSTAALDAQKVVLYGDIEEIFE
jgi:hypothetical protein